MLSRILTLVTDIAISTQCLNAQSTFGSIVGVVKDPGGLVVAGAKISLSSLEDKSTRDAVSDGAVTTLKCPPIRRCGLPHGSVSLQSR